MDRNLSKSKVIGCCGGDEENKDRAELTKDKRLKTFLKLFFYCVCSLLYLFFTVFVLYCVCSLLCLFFTVFVLYCVCSLLCLFFIVFVLYCICSLLYLFFIIEPKHERQWLRGRRNTAGRIRNYAERTRSRLSEVCHYLLS